MGTLNFFLSFYFISATTALHAMIAVTVPFFIAIIFVVRRLAQRDIHLPSLLVFILSLLLSLLFSFWSANGAELHILPFYLFLGFLPSALAQVRVRADMMFSGVFMSLFAADCFWSYDRWLSVPAEQFLPFYVSLGGAEFLDGLFIFPVGSIFVAMAVNAWTRAHPNQRASLAPLWMQRLALYAKSSLYTQGR